jgi:hypothetical protein
MKTVFDLENISHLLISLLDLRIPQENSAWWLTPQSIVESRVSLSKYFLYKTFERIILIMENRSSILFASCTLAFVIVAVTTFSTQLSQAAIDCKPRCSEVEQQQHKEMDNQLNKARTELYRGNSTGAFVHLDSINNNLINRHACLPSCALHAGAQQHLNNSRVDIQQGDNTAALVSLDQAQSILQKHFESRAVNASNIAT